MAKRIGEEAETARRSIGRGGAKGLDKIISTLTWHVGKNTKTFSGKKS